MSGAATCFSGTKPVYRRLTAPRAGERQCGRPSGRSTRPRPLPAPPAGTHGPALPPPHLHQKRHYSSCALGKMLPPGTYQVIHVPGGAGRHAAEEVSGTAGAPLRGEAALPDAAPSGSADTGSSATAARYKGWWRLSTARAAHYCCCTHHSSPAREMRRKKQQAHSRPPTQHREALSRFAAHDVAIS